MMGYPEQENNISLIIGTGEVGTALYNVLKDYHIVYRRDKNTGDIVKRVGVLHICFPYSDSFVREVKRYQEKYKPQLTIIHSTVAPGTSRKCDACHSPVRGIHPEMEESLKTFVKFIGGKGADRAAEYFRKAGIKTHICRKAKTTEIGKILSTTYYGLCINFAKEAEKLCQKYDIPFSEAYTLFQQTYNDGYEKLNRSEVKRPILQPIQKEIGGHCILPNCELLDWKFTNLIKDLERKN